MKQRTKTGNARNRVKAGALDPALGLLRRQCELEKANKELTVQLANALERIGWMEQRWHERDLHEKTRIRRELDSLLAARQARCEASQDALNFGVGVIRMAPDEPVKRSFWRRVFSAESGGKLLTIARAGVLLALFLVLLGLGVAIGHAAAAVLRGGG